MAKAAIKYSDRVITQSSSQGQMVILVPTVALVCAATCCLQGSCTDPRVPSISDHVVTRLRRASRSSIPWHPMQSNFCQLIIGHKHVGPRPMCEYLNIY